MIVQTVVKWIVIIAFVAILAEMLKRYHEKVKAGKTTPGAAQSAQAKPKSILEMLGGKK